MPPDIYEVLEMAQRYLTSIAAKNSDMNPIISKNQTNLNWGTSTK